MWVKLCGVRDLETARVACALGADAIGLNFYAPSPRSVDPAVAREIARSLPPGTEAIGLFVNHPLDEILQTATECSLGTIQLHGDETPEFVATLKERLPKAQIIRAFRVGEEGCSEIEQFIKVCGKLGVTLRSCLVDARVTGSYGGTGHVAPWDILAREYRRDLWPPIILAGGLDPTNVADAIRAVQPWGVDVSSGIESSPGVKDPAKMKSFVSAARQVS